MRSENPLKKRVNDFKRWFNEKEHPRSKLNKTVFLHDSLKLFGLILIFLIIYNNSLQLNEIVIIFFKLGGVLQLTLGGFILIKLYQLGLNLKYWFRGLNNGFKLIIILLSVLIIFVCYQNQTEITSKTLDRYEKVNWESFNFLKINLSKFNLGEFANKLNSCPQINVSMQNDWMGLNIHGQTYDGWVIKGDATCRKGTKEGENLNKYYCGGYTYNFLGGTVNAYIEKTIVSTKGDIGKTNKYVIWNTYDENKKFIETKCLGDPDEFDKKQADAFYNELLKWR